LNFPNIITTPCIPTTPPPLDPRCSDPAFARAYPGICVGAAVLILKPSDVLQCVLGSIQFKAFLEQNGTETLITSGVVFSSSNTDVAVIGASNGSASGVASGSVTITATYTSTNNGVLTATANLTVLGVSQNCCSGTEVATMLAVDTSVSMSLAFGSGYSTKEAYATALAAQYAQQTNTQKDLIGLISFDATPTTIVPLPVNPSPANATAVSTSAAALTNTPNLTGIGLALQAAATALQATNSAIQVIVLFSDGEDTDTLAADAPLPIAEAFQNAGGIIVCVGIRSHDAGFDLLNGLATGGFFLNAYPVVATTVLNTLMGIKGYFCAGNCVPAGNTYEPTGAYDYTAFINWNVTAGHVDLSGNGVNAYGPGNPTGLYIDMDGTSSPTEGTITSKTAFSFVPGVNYALSFDLSGNNRISNPGQAIVVSISNGVLNHTISMPDFLQGFTTYTLNFTVNSPVSGNISFQQIESTVSQAGNFLDNIVLTNITTGAVIFSDNFDNENLQYVLPGCGPGLKITGGAGNSIASPNAVTVGDNINPGIGNPPPCCSAGIGAGPCTPSSVDPFGNCVYNASGNTSGSFCTYDVSLVTAHGETGVDVSPGGGIVAGYIEYKPTSGNPNVITLGGTTDPSTTNWKLYRNDGLDAVYTAYTLIATLPIGTTTYTDSATSVSGGTHPQNTNTTSFSVGDMSPGDVYTYALSYVTAIGETLLSASASHTVGTGAHSQIVTLPGSVPASVTNVHLWRQETVGMTTRFYLLATLSPSATTYTDLQSHADFLAILNPIPAVPVSNTTGMGYAYFPYYGYACYGYGCLDQPPGAQLQDPNPLANIEIGYVPPTTYTSTQSFTAVCPAGTTQANSVSAIPVMTSANTPAGYVVTDSSEQSGYAGWQAFGAPFNTDNSSPSGWRTTGANTMDWIKIQLPSPQEFISYAITPNYPIGFNGNNDTFNLFGSNDGTTWNFVANLTTAMLQSGTRYVFPITNPGSYLYYIWQNAVSAASTVFGIGLIEYFTQAPNNNGVTRSATATSTISQADANNKALIAATSAATAALAYAGCIASYSSTQSSSATCPCGTLGTPNTVIASASYVSFISQQDANTQALALATAAAQAQLNCTASNNTSQITINDSVGNQPTAATPYPSVEFQPTVSTHITAITVAVNGFTHTYPQDVSVLLVSPSGKAIVLMSQCGGSHSISGVNLVFSDAAGSNLPVDSPPGSGTPIVSGTFKPTQNNTPVFPLCAKQSGYLTTLNSVVGDSPSGSWALFVVDSKFLDVGTIASWSISLTLA
jgi:subtilisin-like proprotein convertase family protein